MSLYASGIVRIISDPQLKAFESGTMVCNFGGGIQEGKDKNGEYINNAIDVEAWGKTAEIIVDKLKKGACLAIGNHPWLALMALTLCFTLRCCCD
jgi:single-stranded DNA-binding protein